jgi:hypothetical protein
MQQKQMAKAMQQPKEPMNVDDQIIPTHNQKRNRDAPP